MTVAVTALGRSKSKRAVNLCLVLSFTTLACSGRLDAGGDSPRGLLPVDNRNPIVLCNDGPNDNWAGEYAALFASTGTLALAGIVIGTGPNDSTNLDDNISGWRKMVAAAQQSGMQDIPDPMASSASALVRPSNGDIDSTTPNRSEGAHLIIDTSMRLSQPFRPLVVVTAGKLTDVADAYLMDHTLPERVVVVSALGTVTTDGGKMGMPNGELDTWADAIVAQKFRYVQVSAYYDQKGDVSDSLLAQLPVNAFTTWIQDKKNKVYDDLYAADQVAVVALAIPEFVSAVARADQQDVGADNIPMLTSNPSGPVWLVTEISGSLATARLWQMLLDPATFHPQ